MDLFGEVVALAAALEAAAIDYAVCGGVALAIHGAPRATRTIDVMAREVDLPRLREAIRRRGFTIEALPMTFTSSGISIRRFTRIEPDGRTLMLDILLAEGPLDAVWQSRVRIQFAAPGDPPSALWVARRGAAARHRRYPEAAGGRPWRA